MVAPPITQVGSMQFLGIHRKHAMVHNGTMAQQRHCRVSLKHDMTWQTGQKNDFSGTGDGRRDGKKDDGTNGQTFLNQNFENRQ